MVSEEVTLARLVFHNVPTKTGGVVSGNISTGAGSPFGSGGKYEAQITSIKDQIAKKPVGYYDPPPNVLWKDDNPVIRAELEDTPKIKSARDILANLLGMEKYYAGRYDRRSSGDKLSDQFKIEKQRKIIKDEYERLLAEKNAPIIQAREEQKAREADLERKLETELWIQQALDKQIINQRPTPTPSTPTPAVTSSLPIIPIIIIAVIVGFFLLRRRA